MLDDMDYCCVAIALAISLKKKEKKKRRWMKDWYKKRNVFTHQNLLNELALSEPNDFRNFMRMDDGFYNELLEMITPIIIKKNTKLRDAIPPSQRLSITLRFLATGNTFEDLKFTSAISPQSIGLIVTETALIHVLKDYIKMPQTEDEWIEVANGYNDRWNFPNCLGSIDGKHVAIKKPPNSGSYFYNYKKYHSIVLMAVVNSDYEFMMVDAGINGRISDGGVLSHTEFGKAFTNKSLHIPGPRKIPNSDKKLPFVFIGDDAFALTDNFMKPYGQIGLNKEKRIFNYRLSRARRIVENAFGILVSRFGVFQRPINLSPEKAQTIVLTCCYLHNCLRRNQQNKYISRNIIDVENLDSGQIIDGDWRTSSQLTTLQNSHSRNSVASAKSIRDSFCHYFNNEGQVSWQNKFI